PTSHEPRLPAGGARRSGPAGGVRRAGWGGPGRRRHGGARPRPGGRARAAGGAHARARGEGGARPRARGAVRSAGHGGPGLHRGGRAVHAGHDRAPRAGDRDGAHGPDARGRGGGAAARREDRHLAARRDRADGAVARGAGPGRAGRGVPAGGAHARDADARADGAARCGARPGVRPAVPDVHDRAPPRRARDGRGAVRQSGGGTGPGHLPVRDGCGRGPARRDLRHAGHAEHARHHRRGRIAMRGYVGKVARRLAGAAMIGLAVAASTAPLAAQRKAMDPRADTVATTDDPRVGLGAGAYNNAGVALWNMRLVSYTPKPAELDSARGLAFINSDLAFRGNLVYQGYFCGFMIWDVSDPRKPVLLNTTVCATDQGDPSIYGNLLFISAESPRSRIDCGMQGVQDGKDRMRGVRIFDVSDPRNPRLIKNVQTCRGSHTHTIVPHPTDSTVIYIYVGGSAAVRDSSELPGCSDGTVDENPNTAHYRVDIIRVPLANPEQAEVVGYARIF